MNLSRNRESWLAQYTQGDLDFTIHMSMHGTYQMSLQDTERTVVAKSSEIARAALHLVQEFQRGRRSETANVRAFIAAMLIITSKNLAEARREEWS